MDKTGEAHPSIFSRGVSGRLNSLSVVLSQEIDRFNRLTKQMQSSLRELQKALKGLVVMSDELEQMLHSMLDSKVCEICAAPVYTGLRRCLSGEKACPIVQNRTGKRSDW